MENTIRKVSNFLEETFCNMDAEECREIIKTASELTGTNCWYLDYWVKDILIKMAESRLHDLNFHLNKQPQPQTNETTT